MDTVIRAIKSEQLPELRKMCLDFFRESKYPGGFCAETFDGFWGPLIDNGHAIILTAERVNTLMGMAGVVFSPSMFNGADTSTLHFWYVRPEARRCGIGAQFHDRIEFLSRHRGSRSILAGHILTINPTGMREFYETRGFVLRELVFRKELV